MSDDLPTEGHPLKEPVKERVSVRDFRSRAHSNPLSDGNFDVPARPADVDWAKGFELKSAKSERLRSMAETDVRPEWVDIGCGYGGLLAGLSTEFPDRLMVGMEIRALVLEYCYKRLKKLRAENEGSYGNIWYLRTNVMKFLVHYLEKASVEKMFFCYPDPHFKRRKHRQRIISMQLLAQYAYVLKPLARVYIVTDVRDLFEWMDSRLDKHPLFERLSVEEMVGQAAREENTLGRRLPLQLNLRLRARKLQEADPVTAFVRDRTDEAARVDRNGGEKFVAVFRRAPDPPAP